MNINDLEKGHPNTMIAPGSIPVTEELNLRGPTLRAVLEVNPDALGIARELDRERKARGPRGPLHGIPVLIKANIDTHDRMMTTAGSSSGWSGRGGQTNNPYIKNPSPADL